MGCLLRSILLGFVGIMGLGTIMGIILLDMALQVLK